MRSFAVVRAAGRSRRMGTPKLLLPWGGVTLLEHVAAAWRDSRVTRAVIVLHPHDAALAERCRVAGLAPLVARFPPADMKASVLLGLAEIALKWSAEAEDVWLLAPADVPGVSAALIDALLAAHDPAAPRPIVAAHHGRRGHPVLFPWPMAADVARLPHDAGVDAILAGTAVRELDWPDDAPLADLDTPDDYRRLHARFAGP